MARETDGVWLAVLPPETSLLELRGSGRSTIHARLKTQLTGILRSALYQVAA